MEEVFGLPKSTEGLDDDEKADYYQTARGIIDMIPTPALASMAAGELFGDDFDSGQDNICLIKDMDEKADLQGELLDRVYESLDQFGYTEPDLYKMQVLGRTAGYVNDIKFGEENMDIYCLVTSIREKQTVSYGKEDYQLDEQGCTPMFKYKVGDENRPFVKNNRKQMRMKDGRLTLKKKDYRNILIWTFWKNDPKKLVDKKIED